MQRPQMFKGKSGKIYKCSSSKPLGEGSFGKVMVFTEIKELKVYAVKMIPKSTSYPVDRIEAERNLLNSLRKANNLVYSVDSGTDDDYYYIVMPYYDMGNLFRFITEKRINTEIKAIEILRQICHGIQALHMMNYIHRDIKAENIFIAKASNKEYKHPYISIGDFGLAKHLDLVNDEGENLTSTVGTGTTRAPEVKTGKYDYESDIYSIGCVLFQMITGKLPFLAYTSVEVDSMKDKTDYLDVHSRISDGPSSFLLAILEGCLQYDVKNRISSEYLFKILETDKLYSDYSELKYPSEKDASTKINLKNWKRKFPDYSNHLASGTIRVGETIISTCENSSCVFRVPAGFTIVGILCTARNLLKMKIKSIDERNFDILELFSHRTTSDAGEEEIFYTMNRTETSVQKFLQVIREILRKVITNDKEEDAFSFTRVAKFRTSSFPELLLMSHIIYETRTLPNDDKQLGEICDTIIEEIDEYITNKALPKLKGSIDLHNGKYTISYNKC